MVRTYSKVRFALGLLVGTVALNASCAENNETLFVRRIQAIAQPTCAATNDPTTIGVSTGVMDVALTSTYAAAPLVGSQLIAKGDPKTSRAEPNRVLIKGAEIHLTTEGGAEIAPLFTSLGTGVVDPTLSADAGYGVMVVNLIPASIGKKLRDQLRGRGYGSSLTVLASFNVFGTTLGNTEVKTTNFVFPITVCYGCLVDFSGDINDPTLGTPGVPNCLKAPKEGTLPLFCLQGQDTAVDCRLCRSYDACTICSANVKCPQGGTCVGGRCQ
ncbi:MAG: hypothetical protein NVS3B20_23570 [Polyangiales bacterium]